MLHRFIVVDREALITLEGELVESSDDAATLLIHSADGTSELICVSWASVLGHEEFAA